MSRVRLFIGGIVAADMSPITEVEVDGIRFSTSILEFLAKKEWVGPLWMRLDNEGMCVRVRTVQPTLLDDDQTKAPG